MNWNISKTLFMLPFKEDKRKNGFRQGRIRIRRPPTLFFLLFLKLC
jgi:hypothetical protein